MKYIVFDLEWNQPMDGKNSKERDLLFEILEIGAVKCDEHGTILDSYKQVVRPTVYHKINKYTAQMIQISDAEFKAGQYFTKAVREFLKWCGDEPYTFVTWGNQDVFELRENMNYYKLSLVSGPMEYINLQRIYGILTGEEERNKGLEAAITELSIEKDIPFHRAYSDAYYTAKILALLPKEMLTEYPSYDVYEPPRTKEEEIVQKGNKEFLYIYKAQQEKEKASRTPGLYSLYCPKCEGKQIPKKVDWSSTNTGYTCVAKCRVHGYVTVKIRTRESYKHLYYAEKIIRYITEEEALKWKEKKKKS